MLIISEWCINLSTIALAIVLSPNVSSHRSKLKFVVMIVDLFSYLLDIN